MYHSRKKGFTMVELVIVIAVIAILAAILIPTFTNLIRKANEASALANARNAANLLLANLLKGGENAADLVIFSKKDEGIHVYGYDASEGRVVRYHSNPVASEETDFAKAVVEIRDKLLAAGAIVPVELKLPEEDWRTPEKVAQMVKEIGFADGTMVVYANYRIMLGVFENGGQADHNCTAADLDEIAEVPVTCSTNGYPQYWVCRVCGKMYSSATPSDATRITSLPVTPADGATHVWGKYGHDETQHWQICALNSDHTGTKENHTGNPCSVCGYSTGGNTPTSPAGKKNGLVDGIYYKDDEPLTGTDKGYTFRDGYLVVRDTYGDSDITRVSTPDGYSPVYGYLYNITHHITTPSDASVLTSSIYVGTTAEVANYPFMHFKQQLSVENLEYKATRIQLTLPTLDDIAWNMDSTTLGSNIKGWDAADLRNYLSLVGDSEQSTIPYIIECSDFTSYLTSNGLTVETYVSGYNAGSLSETYAQYLKSKYGEFSTWTISQAEALVNENGTSTDVKMVEPEVIELLLKSFYISTYKNTKIAVFKADGTTVVDAKMVGDCDGIDYKSYYSVEGYSALNSIEVSDGISAVEILTIGVGDYFNGVDICSPTMRICLKLK